MFAFELMMAKGRAILRHKSYIVAPTARGLIIIACCDYYLFSTWYILIFKLYIARASSRYKERNHKTRPVFPEGAAYTAVITLCGLAIIDDRFVRHH